MNVKTKMPPKVNIHDFVGKLVTIPQQNCVRSISKAYSGTVVDVWIKPHSRFYTLEERRIGLWLRQSDGKTVPVFLHGEYALNKITVVN